MNRPDETRRLGPLAALLTALFGVGGGIVLALYSFVQLRTAWLDGVFAFGGRSRPALDFDYDSEPLSYIVAMAALYPTIIVVGVGVALVSGFMLYRQRPGSRARQRTRTR
ncbi:MAG: hypothetical protein ACT6XY_05920 [Phreatobacter sp.]|uniref:hypothetical protein n=1 Tax=Phreatobacter sp. TaxID=1966341 RepID=UPI0040366156